MPASVTPIASATQMQPSGIASIARARGDRLRPRLGRGEVLARRHEAQRERLADEPRLARVERARAAHPDVAQALLQQQRGERGGGDVLQRGDDVAVAGHGDSLRGRTAILRELGEELADALRRWRRGRVRPTRETLRTSTRLPLPSGRMRTTTSSLKPNQRVVSVASMRPGGGVARDHLPAERARGVDRALHRLARRRLHDERLDVGIAPCAAAAAIAAPP